VEYGAAQPAGAEAKGTMRDDCISGRASKVFELRSEKPRTGSRNKEVQCLCGMGRQFSRVAGAVLLTAVAAVAIGAIVFWPHIERFFQ
jgi:hypothetical protein